MKPCSLLFCSLFFFSVANAQFDFPYLSVKGSSGFGGGAFLDLGIPISNGDIIMAEPNSLFFGRGDVFIFPVLAGYRHDLYKKGSGLYIEPLAGYTFGSTSVNKTNTLGTPVTNDKGDTISQRGNGFTAGVGLGYIFPRLPAYGVEFKYEHIFLPGHPEINMISLGWSYMILLKRRPVHDF